MLGVGVGFQNVSERRHLNRLRRPWKPPERLLGRNDNRAFAFLGQTKIQSIQNSRLYLVIKFLQLSFDASQYIALVEGRKLFDIFQNDSAGLFVLNKTEKFKEQNASGIGKSSTLSYNGKWLTWESSEKQIVLGNIVRIDQGDISRRLNTVVGGIRAASLLIYVTGKHDFQAQI